MNENLDQVGAPVFSYECQLILILRLSGTALILPAAQAARSYGAVRWICHTTVANRYFLVIFIGYIASNIRFCHTPVANCVFTSCRLSLTLV